MYIPQFWKELREKHLFEDVTICVGDLRLKAHKALLYGHCELFKSMLTSKMKEGLESEISFPEASPEAVKLLLDFIYNGIIVAKVKQLFDLYDFAHYVGCSDLQTFIGMETSKWVPFANTFYLALDSAILVQDKSIIQEAITFFKKYALFIFRISSSVLQDISLAVFDIVLSHIELVAVWDVDILKLIDDWKLYHNDDLSSLCSFNAAFLSMVKTRKWTLVDLAIWIYHCNETEKKIIESVFDESNAITKFKPTQSDNTKREVEINSSDDEETRLAKKLSVEDSDYYHCLSDMFDQ